MDQFRPSTGTRFGTKPVKNGASYQVRKTFKNKRRTRAVFKEVRAILQFILRGLPLEDDN